MKKVIEPGVGAAAPRLELPNEAGEPVSLAALAGRPVLISFLSHAA